MLPCCTIKVGTSVKSEVERADKTARILDVKYFILLPSVKDVGTTLMRFMDGITRSTSAYEMYRKRGQHRITPKGVAKFLILDREFPRSIQFCLIRQSDRCMKLQVRLPEPGKPCRAF